MASVENKLKATAKTKTLSQEQIIQGFNDLRQQQRAIVTKISELEMEKKEHELVADTLKDVAADRKCYRMVGGILVERTVKDVLPALLHNVEQMKKLLESLQQQLETKGKDLQEYKEKNNIKIQTDSGGNGDERSASESGTGGGASSKVASAPGVLVANSS